LVLVNTHPSRSGPLWFSDFDTTTLAIVGVIVALPVQIRPHNRALTACGQKGDVLLAKTPSSASIIIVKSSISLSLAYFARKGSEKGTA
jgi:hypothetical protein